jgi:hypothetical protein
MQKVEYLKLVDLILWTENPRDPVDKNATDLEIIERALEDTFLKWDLSSLAKEMGNHYDFSELPTVVIHEGKPIVYDGNRRIALGKIKLGYVNLPDINLPEIPDFPESIPCNICSRELALNNILRKHSNSGSWKPLERDMFLHKHMGKEKSNFLIIDERTGLISQNPHMNKRFVKDEIFTESNLIQLGFEISNQKLITSHNNKQASSIFNEISDLVARKEKSTRNNRKALRTLLSAENQEIIKTNVLAPKKELEDVSSEINTVKKPMNSSKTNSTITRRVKSEAFEFFGEKLILAPGDVSNLYRDINDAYEYYQKNKNKLSNKFPCILRMALRLICETAATSNNLTMDKYLRVNFSIAKATLNKDKKTILANFSINEESIIRLLHTGAHDYTVSSNFEQTSALSIIIGKMLLITHGKESK